jgi:inner membrane protein
MNWFTENLPETLVIIGLALLIVEILILGFATFIFFFVGVAAILTGLMMYMGVLEHTLISAMTSTAIITVISALLLWKPLKKMQNTVDPKNAANDLIGHQLTAPSTISSTESATYKFSGITWQLTADKEIIAGTQVEVIDTQVGILKVQAVQS